MPETLILNFQLTGALWRLAFETHYRCDRSLRLCYLFGVICIFLGSFGFGGFYQSKLMAGLLLATGFFGVLLKPLLVVKSLREVRRHPFFGKELTVLVSPAELSVRSDQGGDSQPWTDFIGYRRLEPGFLLYYDRNLFFYIPLSVMTAGYAKRLEQILTAAEVLKL